MTKHGNDSSTRSRPICCLVGNGPVGEDAGDFIDRADYVIRFNRCAGLNGVTGSKIDRLYLCNTGRVATRWSSQDFERIIPHAGVQVVFSYPRPSWLRTLACIAMGKRGSVIDSSEKLTEVLCTYGVSPQQADRHAYTELQVTLGAIMSSKALPRPTQLWLPSSGCIALHQTMRDPGLANHDVHLFGFGFSGANLHAWAAERTYAEALRDRGKIRLHH